mgnify:CR=1 FL=1
MSLTLGAIVEALGGRLLGPSDMPISGLAPLQSAQPSHISFLSQARYQSQLAGSLAGCVIVSPALESQVADIKQCTLDGEADHILAARFLNLFVGDVPWMHLDLSAATCKGGLGAVGTDTTGFGTAVTLEFLQTIAARGLPKRLAAF